MFEIAQAIRINEKNLFSQDLSNFIPPGSSFRIYGPIKIASFPLLPSSSFLRLSAAKRGGDSTEGKGEEDFSFRLSSLFGREKEEEEDGGEGKGGGREGDSPSKKGLRERELRETEFATFKV